MDHSSNVEISQLANQYLPEIKSQKETTSIITNQGNGVIREYTKNSSYLTQQMVDWSMQQKAKNQVLEGMRKSVEAVNNNPRLKNKSSVLTDKSPKSIYWK